MAINTRLTASIRQTLSKTVSQLTGTAIDELSLRERDDSSIFGKRKLHEANEQRVMTVTNTAHKQAKADDIWMGERDPGKVVTGEFVKDMTHELHTPLNVIIGLCQLLERDRNAGLSPMQHDAVQRMERNAHTLLQTVDHLLACMRSGRFE